jgi:hypothetical protein
MSCQSPTSSDFASTFLENPLENPPWNSPAEVKNAKAFPKWVGKSSWQRQGVSAWIKVNKNLGAFDVSDGPAAADEPPQSTRNSANP